jgi:hypothetical protein
VGGDHHLQRQLNQRFRRRPDGGLKGWRRQVQTADDRKVYVNLPRGWQRTWTRTILKSETR